MKKKQQLSKQTQGPTLHKCWIKPFEKKKKIAILILVLKGIKPSGRESYPPLKVLLIKQS